MLIRQTCDGAAILQSDLVGNLGEWCAGDLIANQKMNVECLVRWQQGAEQPCRFGSLRLAGRMGIRCTALHGGRDELAGYQHGATSALIAMPGRRHAIDDHGWIATDD